jgi:hypothetical protein
MAGFGRATCLDEFSPHDSFGFGITMNPPEMVLDLRSHQALCEQLLQIVQRENQSLCAGDNTSTYEYYQGRKNLLPLLEQSLSRLKQHRVEWQRLNAEERTEYPQIATLIRSSQELINKILMMDRENEQLLLRRGLLPANKLPPAQQQRPHFVADLYRRNIGK